jgi:molybdate transport repressor ModE-like protein
LYQKTKRKRFVVEKGKICTGAVIVAAGMSSRMGDFKPMLKIGSMSMVRRIVADFQQAGVSPVVLVTGYRGSELEKHLSQTGVICVRNENFATTQMFDSAKIGFAYIADKCDRTFFTPVDIPLFRADTVLRLMETDAAVVKPVCKGVDGHPILLSNRVVTQLLEMQDDCGLKNAIDTCCKDEVVSIAVDDEGILFDADTPQEYEKLVACHNRQLFRPDIEISLVCDNKLFDKDAALLLRMIVYTGTVKGACEKMQISYSKAWGMLSVLEKNLGFSLVERHPGGEYGGESQLTCAGQNLLDRYEAFADQVKKYANLCFEECFGKNEGMQ